MKKDVTKKIILSAYRITMRVYVLEKGFQLSTGSRDFFSILLILYPRADFFLKKINTKSPSPYSREVKKISSQKVINHSMPQE